MHQWKPTKGYWRAYNELYGQQIELGEKDGSKGGEKKKKKPKVICPTEVYEQIVFATWLDKKCIPYYHIPNGGYRDAREGAKFKRMGTKAGVPDVCVVVPRFAYHGLYIEVKREVGGRLSEAQEYWRDLLFANGYFWGVGNGAKECIKIVCDYLGLPNNE